MVWSLKNIHTYCSGDKSVIYHYFSPNYSSCVCIIDLHGGLRYNSLMPCAKYDVHVIDVFEDLVEGSKLVG